MAISRMVISYRSQYRGDSRRHSRTAKLELRQMQHQENVLEEDEPL